MNLDLSYPIGKWIAPEQITSDNILTWIEVIERTPMEIKELIQNVKTEDLKIHRYRPNGWTIHQVIYHMTDSHMHAYIRQKLALTDNVPVINPYKEGLWADMPDALEIDTDQSLVLLELLHYRWSYFLKRINPDELSKTYYHPEKKREITIEESIGMYAWHSKHHTAHIRNAVQNPY